ncbi:BglG family transcription antiterminator [Clostridium sp. JS66]|uniref:BglG family transcription antiterminator n=1 Tax=Clostridium sp. JS66 TaxID=3064705 RepID=UPI00298E5B26|nr:BglG family transcription antiterminator [Clostridium sp. JS66]WPC44587.1 BglG family transcription antiterminator [Clostridium sp. JS66]
MIDLTARQKFVLNTIIEKGSLGIKDLSQQIDVSSRTISRDIVVINKFLSDRNVYVNENKSSLYIEGEKEALKSIQQSLGGIPLQWLLSQEQRLLLITAQLLLAHEPYKSAYFSYQFNVVEGSISLYMDKIEQWLNIRNLSLIRKRGYGIAVEGSEWNKRSSFIEVLYEYKPIDELLAFIYGSKKDQAINAFFKTVFGEELITISKNLLELLGEEIVTNKDDIAYFGSFIHILLSLKKTKLNSPIELPDYLIQDILSSKEFYFIHEIKKYLFSLNINLADSELSYVAIQLMGNKYIYKTGGKFKELDIPMEILSSEVVHEVGKKLNIKIECDEQLILGLSQHFNPALYRINMGIQVKNPLVDEIKNYYGDLFKAVDYACRLVFSKYNVTMSQDEIGYITMHIGAAIERSNVQNNKLSVLVICPNGIGTARILSNKIKAAIPNVESVTISSFKDWPEGNSDYDIVLSTVNIDGKADNQNIITVSPFLQNEDVDKINSFIKKRNLDNSIFNNITSLPDIEKIKDPIIIDEYNQVNNILKNLQLEFIDTDSFSTLVMSIVESLFDNKLISNEEEIKNLIFKREELGSVVIPNSHIALLHTRSDTVKNPFVGVYRLKHSIQLKSSGFEDESVDTFIVLLARKNEYSYVLEKMGKISIALIEDKNFTEILRLGDIKDLRNSIIKILNQEET